MFLKIKKIHFIGIGGIGMSGIAEILINKGFIVSGSDETPSENTDHLLNLGATIYFHHHHDNVQNTDLIVYSAAIDINTNIEILTAKQLSIPIIRRAEMLAEISRLNYTIAVAGTHGKTTATSMLALTLIQSGIDPTVVVGGRLKDLGGTNARLGQGDWSIVEADEYDRSFLQLTPTIAVINNIEPEHLDIYSNFKDLLETFEKFANMTPFYGYIAACIDCEGVKQLIPSLRKKIYTYGLSDGADYQAKNITYKISSSISNLFSTQCDVYEFGQLLGRLVLNVPGEYNIVNALVTVLVARQFDINFDIIANVIAEFRGAFRRFEIKGIKKINDEFSAIIVDDYAHHPTEIKATLKGAKQYLDKRIIAIFQPHTFTRTRDFYKDFANAFVDADIVYITDIYPARETPIPNITSDIIFQEAKNQGHNNIYYVPDMDQLFDIVNKILKPNDVLITMGAGDIWKFGERILK